MNEKDLQYISGGYELLERLRPLWEKLNLHHESVNVRFRSFYRQFTFDSRRVMLREKAVQHKLRIVVVTDLRNRKDIGYCISTIMGDPQTRQGEIESIFIEAEYRGYGVGDKLMHDALKWMDENNIQRRVIGVAAGNEDTFGFYEKFGFYPRVTILHQLKQEGTS